GAERPGRPYEPRLARASRRAVTIARLEPDRLEIEDGPGVTDGTVRIRDGLRRCVRRERDGAPVDERRWIERPPHAVAALPTQVERREPGRVPRRRVVGAEPDRVSVRTRRTQEADAGSQFGSR